jgi:pyruvate dehydrogenase E1 component alpha subunit
LAAVWKLPIVFLCENNGYAICTAQAQTTSVVDIAARAVAYNMPGEIVDGQDVLAVYNAVSAAVGRARRGVGPTLVEAKTYRYCDHEEDCEFPPYRPEEEIELWRQRDPIELFTAKLRKDGETSAAECKILRAEVDAEVTAAVAYAQESPVPEARALFEDLFV